MGPLIHEVNRGELSFATAGGPVSGTARGVFDGADELDYSYLVMAKSLELT